jgi:hypothetical protein
VVLELQEHLMPVPGRAFPDRIELQHDYVAYYRSATRTLWTSGHAGRPEQPLTAHPAAAFTVEGDPLGLCTDGIYLEGDARNEALQGDFHIGAAVANELASPLIRILPLVSGHGITNLPEDLPELQRDDESSSGGVARSGGEERSPVSVSVLPRRS